MQSLSKLLARALVAVLLVANAASQQDRRPAPRERGAPREREKPSPDFDLGPDRTLELAVSADSLWLSYRDLFPGAKAFTTYGFLASQDDDYSLSARLVRFGVPRRDTPLGLGIGLGLLGAKVDETDEEVLAVTLTGNLDYRLDLAYPLRVGLEASFAPSVASFFDGQSVLDLSARVELELSSWAFAFVGYRNFEVELDEGGHHDIDSALHVGVRLGF